MFVDMKPSEAPCLEPQLQDVLQNIEPSIDGQLKYFPCSVELKSRKVLNHVCFVEAGLFGDWWGEQGRQVLNANEILNLQECPDRLPPKLASKLYQAGESGMGYTLFQIEYEDGSVSSHSAGNLIDFVRLPAGTSRTEIADVIPHCGRNSLSRLSAPDHVWCLFKYPDS